LNGGVLGLIDTCIVS